MFPPVTSTPPLVPDDAAQDVQRRVGAHELQPPVPVDRAFDRRSHRRRLPIQPVPNDTTFLAHVQHLPLVAARVGERARVMGLAASGRIEDSPVKCDRVVAHCDDGCFGARLEGVAQIDLVGLGVSVLIGRHGRRR